MANGGDFLFLFPEIRHLLHIEYRKKEFFIRLWEALVDKGRWRLCFVKSWKLVVFQQRSDTVFIIEKTSRVCVCAVSRDRAAGTWIERVWCFTTGPWHDDDQPQKGSHWSFGIYDPRFFFFVAVVVDQIIWTRGKKKMFISRLLVWIFFLFYLTFSIGWRETRRRGRFLVGWVKEPAARFFFGWDKFLPGWVMAQGERERTPRRIIYMAKAIERYALTNGYYDYLWGILIGSSVYIDLRLSLSSSSLSVAE